VLPINFIIDRTKKDVDHAKHLNAKIANRTATAAEKAEWLSGLKGSYNYTDLNRVESAVSDLAGYLGVTLETKTNWTAADEINGNNMSRFVSNLQEIKKRYFAATSIPGNMSGFSYESANNIEKMLVEAYENKNRYARWNKYSAEQKLVEKYTRLYEDEVIGTTGTKQVTTQNRGEIIASENIIFDEKNGFTVPFGSYQPINNVVGWYDSIDHSITGDKSLCVKITEKPIYMGYKDLPIEGINIRLYIYRYNYVVVGCAIYAPVPEYTKKEYIGGSLIPPGQLPNGTLVEGSIADGYVYIQENDGQYYYYELS
jgi:hypothetical protein